MFFPNSESNRKRKGREGGRRGGEKSFYSEYEHVAVRYKTVIGITFSWKIPFVCFGSGRSHFIWKTHNTHRAI